MVIRGYRGLPHPAKTPHFFRVGQGNRLSFSRDENGPKALDHTQRVLRRKRSDPTAIGSIRRTEERPIRRLTGRGPKERQERVQHLHRDVDQENHRCASQKDQGRVEQRLKRTQHPQEREEPQGFAGISLDATATGALRGRSLDQLDVIEIRTALEALSSRHFLISTAVKSLEQVNYVEVLLMID
jgi:hypothetical protein